MKSSSTDMCEGPLLKKFILYTRPIILTGILQLLFNAADLVVIGRYRGSVSVGAIGATGAVINLIVNLFIGLSVGAGVTVAHAIGASHERDISKTVHTAIPTAAVCGIILTAIGICGAGAFLRFMDTPQESIALSTTYMRIYCIGMTPSMLYNFGAAILRAAGDTQRPLYYLTAAGIINVLLNLFFVRSLGMDVEGVATATVISQTVSAALVIYALMKRTDSCKFTPSKMRIHGKQFLKIVRIGLPAGIQGSLFSVSNVIIQSSVNSFGQIVLNGNSAAMNIEGFVYTTMNSFHQTTLYFTGQNYGARKYDRIGKIMKIALASVFIAGLSTGLLAYSFARPLLGIYLTDSPESIKYGVTRLAYICIPYFLCGLMDVTTGLIRGMGLSISPMAITVLGVCGFRILWIYTVFRTAQYHSPESLYISYTISWTLTFITQLAVFLHVYRKKKRLAASTA